MSGTLQWWHRFRDGLYAGGFREYEDTPVESTTYDSYGEAGCPDEACDGTPEYYDFVRNDEYLAFIVCPRCGGVWNPETLEQFH